MNLSIEPYDARCSFGQPVSVIDAETDELYGCFKSVGEAAKARDVWQSGGVYQAEAADKLYADPELLRFPIGNAADAILSLADVNGNRWAEQYRMSEYSRIVDAVRAAVVEHYGVAPVPANPVLPRDPNEPEDEDERPVQGIHDVIGEGPSGLGNEPNDRDPLTGAPGTPPLYAR